MRFPLLAAAVLALISGLSSTHAQVIVLSDFGNSAVSDGSWIYTSATSTLSGTEGIGDFLTGTPQTINIASDRYIQLTATATTAPPGTFSITLTDSTEHTAVATFRWADFTGGATVTKPLAFTTFDFANLATWTLDSGASLQTLNVSFTQLAATVPEPSTWLLLTAAGISMLWMVRRARRKTEAGRI